MGPVPRISVFYGIVIAHAPPHFHAVYAEHEATIEIATLEVLDGALPARAIRLVREWAGDHRGELSANWEKARNRLPLDSIEPLP